MCKDHGGIAKQTRNAPSEGGFRVFCEELQKVLDQSDCQTIPAASAKLCQLDGKLRTG